MGTILVHIESTFHVQSGFFIYKREDEVEAVCVLLEIRGARRGVTSLTGTTGVDSLSDTRVVQPT